MKEINSIIDQYGQKLYKYCYGMLRNSQEAEDAVQEVFVKAYININKMHQLQSVSSWLYKVAYNHCLNVIRRKKLLFFIPIREDANLECNGFEETFEENELSEFLTMVISRLSVENRSILILRAIEEKSYEEIAVILNKQPDAVRKQYERARKKVKGYLELEKGGKASEESSIL